MNKFKERLVDILAFPKRFIEKLTDRKLTLILGILLIGAINLILPDVGYTFNSLFAEKSVSDVRYNAFMIVVVVAALGVIDVVFIGVPLYDIFRLIKKKEASLSAQYSEQGGAGDGEHGGEKLQLTRFESLKHIASSVKLMKLYIMSHFLVIPVNTLLYYVLVRRITEDSPEWMLNLWLVLFMLIFIWANIIMSRGINVLFRFNPVFSRMTFIIVFTWNFVFSTVFDMKIMGWILRLLR